MASSLCPHDPPERLGDLIDRVLASHVELRQAHDQQRDVADEKVRTHVVLARHVDRAGVNIERIDFP